MSTLTEPPRGVDGQGRGHVTGGVGQGQGTDTEGRGKRLVLYENHCEKIGIWGFLTDKPQKLA